MKKIFALLLATVMLLSMTACGGSAEPVETAPATTEAPTTAPTEAPTEEPTEAPTEIPAEAPQKPNLVAVDPSTLPNPIPVEEQLKSADTQTVVFDTLQEYEDLLHNIGFPEVSLDNDVAEASGIISYCEPVSLTYNSKAFRFDFTHCYKLSETAEEGREEGWSIYGTKSNTAANVSVLKESNFSFNQVADLTNREYEGKSLAFFTYTWTMCLNHTGNNLDTRTVILQTIYYPATGTLFNYLRNPDGPGQESVQQVVGNAHDAPQSIATVVGNGNGMCWHITPESENVN